MTPNYSSYASHFHDVRDGSRRVPVQLMLAQWKEVKFHENKLNMTQARENTKTADVVIRNGVI